ncbi:rCG63450, isoform CRA_a [Rattus norvegicus]|uniref:RCG63450, isoform CRA_a n=1 Tax=Rattus norvegicus TaxID=10116 RepID=A6HB60_RAT|nr:rCG63450, isoform CRA_a [Rattus norvegicus]
MCSISKSLNSPPNMLVKCISTRTTNTENMLTISILIAALYCGTLRFNREIG